MNLKHHSHSPSNTSILMAEDSWYCRLLATSDPQYWVALIIGARYAVAWWWTICCPSCNGAVLHNDAPATGVDVRFFAVS